MSILFLALDVNPTMLRGDSIHTLELARFLGGMGVSVHLVTAPNGIGSPELGPNVTHYVPPGSSDLTLVRFCRQIASRTGCDVVYERRLSPKISYALSRLLRLPFVIEINGSEDEAEMQGTSRPRKAQGMRHSVRRHMYHQAAKVVAVSDLLAEGVRKAYRLPRNKLIVVPNGVDTERFQPLDKAECRRLLELERGSWVVYVGNLVPWQGVEVLVQAMPLILSRVADAHLAIVGDGILWNKILHLASELDVLKRTHMMGPVPHEQVSRLICAADLCVAPFVSVRNSKIGLSPLKLYEYFACGRPVVASEIPGVAEAIRESGAGELVPSDDPGALSSAISSLLKDEAKMQSMGRNGRNFAVSFCSWAMAAQRVEATLIEAMEDSSQSSGLMRPRS